MRDGEKQKGRHTSDGQGSQERGGTIGHKGSK